MKDRNSKDVKIYKKPFANHEFKKSLGQNFLRDKNLLMSIVHDAGVTNESVVLEVGAGAGTLTREIASKAGAVLSMEVDKSLQNVLEELEREFLNLKVWFADALKTPSEDIICKLKTVADSVSNNLYSEKIKVVANIPYYITTPLIFKFLNIEEVTSITIMVQKEVAERVVSHASKGEYGALSVMVNYYGEPSIKRIVSKVMFYPMPKVDSAVLHIEKKPNRDRGIQKILEVVVKSAFSARRKMLVNNISEAFNIEKPTIVEILNKINIKPTVRAEELTIDQYIQLSRELGNLLQK